MKIIRTVAEIQQWRQAARAVGKSVSFVPTMGFLHQGHLSLLQEGRKRGDLLALSIFVNPTQFGQGEDFDDYPRDLERDSALAQEAGVDVIFAPSAAEMYPGGYATYVNVEGITETLCGASRPGHFRGVCTVVNKLFNLIQPDLAFFGNKDFQQLAVIRRMVADLHIPVEIVGMPIFREVDGLALSSRNVYLSDSQRQQALCLSAGLMRMREQVRQGERDSKVLLKEQICSQSEARIDYLKICHQFSLTEQEHVDQDSVLLVAVYFGNTRLIDNGYLQD